MRDNGIHFVQCAHGTKRGVCGFKWKEKIGF